MTKIFYKDIELEVPESVYEPKEDSVLIADLLMNERPGKALEIGCGSGLLSIILARNSDVTAVDIDPAAVETTKANAIKNHVKLDAFVSDMFDNVKGKFDIIVFYAPYLREKQTKDSRTWAGGRHLKVIGRLVSGAREHLEENGRILLVISSLTGKEHVESMFRKHRFATKVLAEKKVPWETLFVLEAR